MCTNYQIGMKHESNDILAKIHVVYAMGSGSRVILEMVVAITMS